MATNREKCPHCGATNCHRAGFRIQVGKQVQMYICRSCGRKHMNHNQTKPLKATA